MPFIDNADATRYILGPQFSKNNPGFEHEQGLLRSGKLVVHRQSSPPGMDGIRGVVQLTVPAGGPIKTTGRCLAVDADSWYRAMIKSEFVYLRKNSAVMQNDSYVGIATNSDYCTNYMSNEGTHTHLVEFHAPARKFCEYLDAWARQGGKTVEAPKAEGDGGTYGLGLKGHYKGDAGKQFNAFMNDAGMYFRLVFLYLKVV